MTEESTVQQDRTDRDLAPNSEGSATVDAARLEGKLGSKTQQFLASPPAHKRQRTAGENAFDLTTYGGIALVANEVLAVAIMRTTEAGKYFENAYKATQKIFQSIPLANKSDYVRNRAHYILWATASGNILMLPVKLLEDNKGKLVRYFDRLWHGKQADTDPQIINAHEEMDQAPHQSWESIAKGRAITLVSALAVDSSLGHIGAVSTRHLPKDAWYSSLDRISHTAARLAVDKYEQWTGKGMEGTQTRLAARDANNPFKIQPGEGKPVAILAQGIGLLTLSASLTALFYVSSKAFARGKEARLERRAQQAANRVQHHGSDPFSAQDKAANDTAPASANDSEREAEQAPGTRIVQVRNLSRMEDSAPLQQVGG